MQDALTNLHPTLDLTAALPGGPRLCGGRAAFRLAVFITAPGRHFVAHCEVGGVWWRFDDTAVTKLGGFAEARAFALKHKQSEALVGLFFEAAPLAVEDARRAKVGFPSLRAAVAAARLCVGAPPARCFALCARLACVT
jgi:hypothetical protein